MSRHGYSDDYDDDPWALIRWRGQVASAMRGKRGQRLLRDMVAALDAMPVKRLVTLDLERDGEVCALGAVARARGVEVGPVQESIDADDDDVAEATAALFDVAVPLVREVTYENDEGRRYETDEERWRHMRDWAARQIIVSPDELVDAGELP